MAKIIHLLKPCMGEYNNMKLFMIAILFLAGCCKVAPVDKSTIRFNDCVTRVDSTFFYGVTYKVKDDSGKHFLLDKYYTDGPPSEWVNKVFVIKIECP
jgi:hypothetical protein